MNDLHNFIGKTVMVTLHRKRYCTTGKIKVYTGRLTDIRRSQICLESNGHTIWVPKPNFYRDGVKEL